jgi:beta-galactosidase
MRGAILFLAAFAVGAASAAERELSDGWEFRRAGGAWTPVTVPHDWAIEGPFDRTNDLQRVRIAENSEEKVTEKTGRTGALPWTPLSGK